METNELTGIIIGCCIEVHKCLGPGLLESAYEEALCWELSSININFQRQQMVPIKYKEIDLEQGFRADIIVQNSVIVEIKSVEKLMPVHSKQLLTYLRLTNIRVGLLVNFNVPVLKNGIERIINGFD
ncbi:MAG: GxxExxY protein [Planctomycetes bacterium GWF2_40_8]|nr:MAG: GxxExxY protein [Planctomycetes bacterium GWF2_40_8]